MTGSNKKKHGLVSTAGGLKKQKLSSMSRDLKAETKKARAISQLVQAKEKTLSDKKRGLRETNAKVPYNPHMQYLLVGEGNFSFTRALVQNFKERLQRESERAPAPAPVDAAAAAAAKKDDEKDDPKPSGPLSASAAKKFRRKEGFDPAVHVPFLPPNSPFTNPSIRVLATAYDSWRELCFKYEEVPDVLHTLAADQIPVWTSVDATKLEKAMRARRVTADKIAAAQEQERERKVENAAARRARIQKEDEDDAAGIDAAIKVESDEDDEAEAEESKEMETEAVDSALFQSDAETAALLNPKTSPLLFPPFITRRALHALQNDAEAKLHGSQRKKLKEKRAAEAEEMREGATPAQAAPTEAASSSSAAAAAAASTAAAPAPRGPNAAHLKTLARNALTTHSLSVLNPAPRARFHRILFQFPHTGCGIKDTEANNAVHRELLVSFLRNVVANRLVYPINAHGEIHITLKKGEPYRTGWNLVALARQVPGLAFKTSMEFYPQLYAGYEHRRTRGFDQERTLDLSTGAALGPNSDIAFSAGKAGAMTYVFTRESTVMDDEEARFDADWIARYNVAKQAEDTRTGLLQECERIYKDTKARAAQQEQQTQSQQPQLQQQAAVKTIAAHKKRKGESGVKIEPVVKREEIDADEAEVEAEEAEDELEADAAMAPAASHDDDDDAAASAPSPSFSLAAQLRQHFQPRAALAKIAPPKQSKTAHAGAKNAGQKRKQR